MRAEADDTPYSSASASASRATITRTSEVILAGGGGNIVGLPPLTTNTSSGRPIGEDRATFSGA